MVYILPKHLDHLGVKLTKLTDKQAEYIGVPVGALQAGSLPLLGFRMGLD